MVDLSNPNRRCFVCFTFPDLTGQNMQHWRHVPQGQWPQSVHDAVGNLPDYRDRGRIIDGVRVGVSEYDGSVVLVPKGLVCETCGRVSASKTGHASHLRKHAREAVTA